MEKLGYENIDDASPRDITLNTSAEDSATNKTTITEDSPNREYETYVHFFIRDGKKSTTFFTSLIFYEMFRESDRVHAIEIIGELMVRYLYNISFYLSQVFEYTSQVVLLQSTHA